MAQMSHPARAGLPDCRKCGGRPQIHISNDVTPDDAAHAINCTNPNCYNDTHWQRSALAAEAIWKANPVPVGVQGGQGVPADDVNEPIN